MPDQVHQYSLLGICQPWQVLHDNKCANLRWVISTLSSICALRSSSDISKLSFIWLIITFNFSIESNDSLYSISRAVKLSASWWILANIDLLYLELSAECIILSCLSESITLFLCWLSERSFASMALSFVSTESIL